MVCSFSSDAVDVSRGSSMKRDVVDSGESPVMRVAGEGWRSCSHEVDVTASPRNPTLPFLIDRPSEFRE